MIAPLAVDLRALRVLVGPDIKIVPGRAVMARVVQAQQPSGRGSLSIAGYLLEAELPESVQTGDDLRLVVKDVSAERVLLAITDPHDADQAQQSQPSQPSQQTQAQPIHTQAPDPSLVAPPAVPLPGGGDVRVTERDAGGGGARAADRHDVLLRYNAPALGPMDLRVQMDAGELRLSVSLAPGQPLELAQAGAESLRQALIESLPGRAVSVTVSPRRQPLDLYA
jgi:hypothetical protein